MIRFEWPEWLPVYVRGIGLICGGGRYRWWCAMCRRLAAVGRRR